MPAVKNVGEPCAGEPHARIEVAAGGNQTSRASTRRAVQAPLADPTRSRSRSTLPLPWRIDSRASGPKNLARPDPPSLDVSCCCKA